MRLLKSIYNNFFILSTVLLGLASCTDESIPSSQGQYNPAEDPNMVCFPFSIALRGDNTSAETRNNLNEENSTRADGFLDGNDLEHKIDFGTPNECFAIFFENDKVKYLRSLYLVEQLEEGSTSDDSNIEYSVPVIAYIPKDDVTPVDGKNYFSPKLTNILVVLNGGPIYNKIHNAIYKTDAGGDNDIKDDANLNKILNLTWSNAADYENNWNADRSDSNGRIGFNSQELYTMTNSAYYSDGKLMTATPITGFAYASIKDYIDNQEKRPTEVYVERMVAKFSAPTFSTQVIGSDRVFRPDENAMPIVVYSWDGETLVSDQKNWRIHLLGWAINGDESESYIFKHIPEADGYTDWKGDEILWNDPVNYRSYWSVDPHYSSEPVKSGKDFYPWQFRKASDRDDIISIQSGLLPGKNHRIPSLRYNSFYDILNEWQWRNTLHIHENTFDPEGDWYDIYTDETQSERNPSALDGRASVLAGAHLLVAAELYLEKPGGRYINQFDTVSEIYSDRIRRFYINEQSWFKMFIRDFNRALVAQEKMSFPVYDWDEQSSGKANQTYVASPSGECRLFLRQRKDKYKSFDENAMTLEGKELKGETLTEFKYTELTYTVIDNLLKEPGVHLSTVANARNGDGRLLPWISKDNTDWMDFCVIVRNPKGEKLKFTVEGSDKVSTDWSYDMYMSLFHEWFGPIDHYKNGYMYYAGEIKHHDSQGLNHAHYYGTVRNHWYKFHVAAINSLGIPVDDPDQLIIPGNYNYRDQIIVYLDILGWHSRETVVDFDKK